MADVSLHVISVNTTVDDASQLSIPDKLIIHGNIIQALFSC